jgi:hypothetical protein
VKAMATIWPIFDQDCPLSLSPAMDRSSGDAFEPFASRTRGTVDIGSAALADSRPEWTKIAVPGKVELGKLR